MKKILLGLGAILLIGLGLAFWGGERFLLNVRAKQVDQSSFAERLELLQPNIIVRTPEGPGPFPVVFQMHGCAGARLEFQHMWADIAVRNGYMAVIIDSLRPRNVSRPQALETVCTGKQLIGQERAGDLLVVIDTILKRPDVNPEQLVLTGWSHGAWTAMDFLTMDLKDQRPAGLPAYNKARPKIAGAVLFYPYCGIGTRTRINDWVEQPKTLALIAGADTIVDHRQCLSAFDKLEKAGISIDRTIYPDTEHAFDDPFIEEGWKHWHSPENLIDATDKVERFLIALNQ